MIAGADAAFHVLADAGKWQQAMHLATACLAINCGQSLQLLVQSHSVILVTVCPTLTSCRHQHACFVNYRSQQHQHKGMAA